MSDREIPTLLITLLERLTNRVAGRESLELEYKRAANSLPSSMWSTVSAFANTSGGWILLGIDEETRPPSIVGVADANGILQRFFESMRNPQKISSEVCGVADAAIETLNDVEVIVIRIGAAPRKQRPIYIDGNPYRGTYVRRNSGDFKCTKMEVDRMMREASEVSGDGSILPHHGWDDIDSATFARYRQRFRTAKPDHNWNGLSDLEFLHAIRGYRRDRESGLEGLTVAGLLMFGREQSIAEWRTRHVFDFRVLAGDLSMAAEWEDRFVWEGNLLGAFEALYPRLVASVPTPFRLEGPVRVDETPTRTALREALVNLLVHADYAETASSLIFRSPEGYLFRNPGNSRVPEGELGLGQHSDPRNPALAFMFRQINLAEEAGSGIQRIVSTWRGMGYRAPAIDVGADRYEFGISLRHLHIISPEDRAWLQSFDCEWLEAEQLALLIALHDGEVDNLTLRSLTGQHPSDTTKTLQALRDRQFLGMSGWGRGASYQLGPAVLGSSHPSYPHLGAAIQAALPDSARSLQDSAVSMQDSATNLDDLLANLEDSVIGELNLVAQKARGRSHLSTVARDEIVLELCAIAPLSIHQIAALLGRSRAHTQSVVRELVSQGRLNYVIPDKPRTPKQKYTSAK